MKNILILTALLLAPLAALHAADAVFDPCRFGAKPDAKTLCTQAIQKAIKKGMGPLVLRFSECRNVKVFDLAAQSAAEAPELIWLRQTDGALISECNPRARDGAFLKLAGDRTRSIALVANDLSGVAKPADVTPEVPNDALPVKRGVSCSKMAPQSPVSTMGGQPVGKNLIRRFRRHENKKSIEASAVGFD